MGIDIRYVYLGTPVDRFECMQMPLKLFPKTFFDQYKLDLCINNSFVFIELTKAIYGLTQAGIIVNK